MSKFDYEASKRQGLDGVPFYALIMAAMRKADGKNQRKLQKAFSWVWEELQERYDAPGGVLPTDHPAQERRAARAAGHPAERTERDLIERGREEVRQAVLALWNLNDGWLPGVAYKDLAQTLSMDPALFLETRGHRAPAVEAPGSY